MGREQYNPSSAEPVAKNRLFTQYHAQYPEHARKRIVDELVSGKSTHRVLFVTVAFGIVIDCNNIRRIIHISAIYHGRVLLRGREGWKRWFTGKGRYLLQFV